MAAPAAPAAADCSICFCPVDRPVSCEVCPATFCRACFAKWIRALREKEKPVTCP